MATMWEIECVKEITSTWLDTACSCPCVCSCCEDELVLHDSTGTDNYKNDKTSFVFKRDLDDDGYDLKLFKVGAEFTPITIDSNIATIFGYGDLPEDNVANYSGFLIDWYLVYSLHGNGDYYMQGTITKQAIVFNYESKLFILRPFSCDIAKDTVKIQGYQNGYIESEDNDLSGFNWLTSLRVNGKLFRDTPKLIDDSYVNQNWETREIQRKINDYWTLELWPMPTVIAKLIVYNLILNNEFYVSDYNVNQEKFDRIHLYPTEIDQMKSWANNPCVMIVLKFESKVQDRIKRNFKNKFPLSNTGDYILYDTPGDFILYS